MNHAVLPQKNHLKKMFCFADLWPTRARQCWGSLVLFVPRLRESNCLLTWYTLNRRIVTAFLELYKFEGRPVNSYSAQGIAVRRRKNPYLPVQTTQTRTRSNPYPFKTRSKSVRNALENRSDSAFLCAGQKGVLKCKLPYCCVIFPQKLKFIGISICCRNSLV